MTRIVDIAEQPLFLERYLVHPELRNQIQLLKEKASPIAARCKDRCIWMINSAARGGGVAEMMPSIITFLRALGFSAKWAVIETENQDFFALTKRIHNLTHGVTQVSRDFSENDYRLFEEVNRQNAMQIEQAIKPQDILILHDPQVLPLGNLLSQALGIKFLWRCHIGTNRKNTSTEAVWDFLQPFFENCVGAIFTAREYAPEYLQDRITIIHPAIDPLTDKNRHLSFTEIVEILCAGGLVPAPHPVAIADFSHRARQISTDGRLQDCEDNGLFYRPTVLQISRWDRLKGWNHLLEGFARMKRELQRSGANTAENRFPLLARLILAGPDPAYILDDIEGAAAFEEIRQMFVSLDPDIQSDVTVYLLPMASHSENALIVNALQRIASVVVQNSIEEAFGLTVEEALWKGRPVLVSTAFGLRLQIDDGVNGVFVDATDAKQISKRLLELLATPQHRSALGEMAKYLTVDNALIFNKISKYIDVLSLLVNT
uniref:Trehalose synthase n=1 Tax=Candidatus Kentrum sp. FM TaxID=2126340 RepID=A0A450SVY9_9GAMM|nr:MAG: trehalose synthase [Candidatus Kentron sp. FM]VFJ58449.1 MAG: trehalose synthase [Candidatus Kentron sp. FM]VFK12237.1 MAG: trehalose synthase [Candidatus Kentron sp. FM]